MVVSPILSQRLLESLNTSVLLLDANLVILYMNPAAESLLEISGKRGVGATFSDLVKESTESIHALVNAINTGHSYTKREASIELHNHRHLTVDYSASPVLHPDTQQHTLLLEIQGRDRLLRISREEQLIAKQETTRSLVRGLAHEVKNPLGGIRGAAQLLEKELPQDTLKEYTDIIIEEADRLRNLVDRLLGPRQLPKTEAINIHELLERAGQLVKVESDQYINIKRDYDPSIPEFKGDKGHIMQALLNICRNAMQAMLGQKDNHAPQLSLLTRAVTQFTIGNQRHKLVIKIDITDNGPGIPSEMGEQLFYPMISSHPNGSGLGLSISQALINQANGIIEYDSMPGETTFSIYLPLESL